MDGVCVDPQLIVADIDGNTYETILIGNQWWMKENLKITHYQDGDTISQYGISSSGGSYVAYDQYMVIYMLTLLDISEEMYVRKVDTYPPKAT